MKDSLKNKKVLISGQVYTSRTETLEEYLKNKVKILGVIGVAGAFQTKNLARCTLYKDAQRIKEFKLPSILVKKYNRFSQFLLIPVFILYFFSILWARFKLHKKFDLFIGIAFFSTFVGLLLKKMGIIKKLIYYSIDYYPPPIRFGFNALSVKAFHFLDKVCVLNSDVVWHVTSRIAKARERFSGLNRNRYKSIDVPLCYGEKLFSAKPFDEIERHTLGFIGTLSSLSGLQLVVQAMPELVKEIPDIKVRIIGSGVYEAELKRMVNDSSLEEHIIFHGFVEDEKEMLDIISGTAIGLAPWTMSENDNAQFADPGKPKLYAFCGLPTIITRSTAIAREIDNMKAGIAISYNIEEFITAVVKLLKDEKLLKEYRENALKFARKYTSDNVFGSAWEKTLSLISKLNKSRKKDSNR